MSKLIVMLPSGIQHQMDITDETTVQDVKDNITEAQGLDQSYQEICVKNVDNQNIRLGNNQLISSINHSHQNSAGQYVVYLQVTNPAGVVSILGGYKRRKKRSNSRKKLSRKKLSRKKLSRKKFSRKKFSRKKRSRKKLSRK